MAQVLNQSDDCVPLPCRDIWQYLETFLVIMTEAGAATSI